MKQKLSLVFVVALGLTVGFQSSARAVSLVSYEQFDFSQVQYDDRIRISADSSSLTFESSISSDQNQDGSLDLLEKETFFLEGKEADIYLGNLHNRFDVSQSLLYIGIDGEFDSFALNELPVTFDQVTPIQHPSVFFVNPDIKNNLDSALLFLISEKLEDREPNNSPIGENHTIAVHLSDFESSDPDLRLYFGAFGMISNGTLNSYTPENSDVLFMPDWEEMPPLSEEYQKGETGEDPVPEPAPFCLAAFSYLLFITFKRGGYYEPASHL